MFDIPYVTAHARQIERLWAEIKKTPAFQELDWHRRAIADHADLQVGDLEKPLCPEKAITVDGFAQRVLKNHPYWLEDVGESPNCNGKMLLKARPSTPSSQCPIPDGQCLTCGYCCPNQNAPLANLQAEEIMRGEFLLKVVRERQRQVEMFCEPMPPIAIADNNALLAVLMEEIEEVARAIQEGDRSSCQTELIQAAAVCLKIYENFNREPARQTSAAT